MKNLFLMLCSVLIMIFACVEPIEIRLTTEREILVIDATLNDLDQEQSLTIKKTVPATGYASYIPVQGAVVTLIENGTGKYECTGTTGGVYRLPASFRPKVNIPYELYIKLPDGKEYKSAIEKMKAVPDIEKVYTQYVPNGIKDGLIEIDGHFVYLDTYDFPEPGDNYLWTWKLYERQTYCASCTDGLYYPNPPPAGRCSSELQGTGVTFDYFCSGDCWEIYHQTTINVMSDVYSNGNKIVGRPIAKIPFYQSRGALLEIRQQSVTATSFRYIKLLAEQSQGSGTLADTPPAALVGNIKNINDPKENVGGYFMLSSSKTYLLWIDRKENGRPIGLFDGRRPNPEPPNGLRPPSALCIKSRTRTPDKPIGWID